MAETKPTNLFTSGTFISLIIVILSAGQLTIVDILKNGGSIEKYYNLALTLAGAIGISSEKLAKEKEVFTPKWCRFGQNKEDAIAAIAEREKTVISPVLEISRQVSQVTNEVNQVVESVEDTLKSPLNLLKIL